MGLACRGLPTESSAVIAHQTAIIAAFAAVAEEIGHLAGILVIELELGAAPPDVATGKDGSVLALDSAHDELRHSTGCRHS